MAAPATTSFLHQVDSNEYDEAVSTCNTISKNIVSRLKNYKYVSEISYNKTGYHFKFMHKDTHNGVHIFIPPYNNKIIELYYIFNNKRDMNNCVHIDPNSYAEDIIYHMKKCMFNVKTQEDEIKSTLNDFSGLFNSMSNKYYTNINNYNFSIIEKETNNGYNFTINLSKKNYICIKVIQNGKYYYDDKHVYYAQSFDDAMNYITESINENKHNKNIKYYRVIDSRLMNDNYNDNYDIFQRLLTSQNNDENVHNVDHNDPV
jgi:hypothetical protein